MGLNLSRTLKLKELNDEFISLTDKEHRFISIFQDITQIELKNRLIIKGKDDFARFNYNFNNNELWVNHNTWVTFENDFNMSRIELEHFFSAMFEKFFHFKEVKAIKW